ncbi:MAG: flippase-like domain-containing protein [Candidatus Diapherotrites archaeon]|uniref:Flippase-like domain-containing protein n=1 Tax=Candidatus Iainarchaeum sp. TaxID=3101447 RepID=A0A939C9E7_9ARCH|nr:flippase-like domain-containing protein [Candidatus Diapherotrites archaeon]
MGYTRYLALIGIVLFLYILCSVGPFEILGNFSKIDFSIFAVVLALVVPILLLKGLKQQILVSAVGKRLSLVENTRVWLIGFFFGSVTPAKAGDFLRAHYLNKCCGLSLGAGLAATAMERILDLLFMFLAAVLGLLFFSLEFSIGIEVISVLVGFLFLFVIGLAVLSRKRWVSFLLRPIFKFLLPEKFKERFKSGFHDFYNSIFPLVKKRQAMLTLAVLTVGSWLLIIFQYYLIAVSLQLPVSFELILSVMPAILLIEALPISFAGVGTRDATTIFLLGFAGIAAASAVSFSLAILAMNMLTTLIGLAALTSFKGREALPK